MNTPQIGRVYAFVFPGKKITYQIPIKIYENSILFWEEMYEDSPPRWKVRKENYFYFWDGVVKTDIKTEKKIKKEFALWRLGQ